MCFNFASVGSTALQTQCNKAGYQRLIDYYSQYEQQFGSVGSTASSPYSLQELLDKLGQNVNDNKKKNVEVLQLSSEVIISYDLLLLNLFCNSRLWAMFSSPQTWCISISNLGTDFCSTAINESCTINIYLIPFRLIFHTALFVQIHWSAIIIKYIYIMYFSNITRYHLINMGSILIGFSSSTKNKPL